MALPKKTKLRKGDTVALHATVKYDFDPAEGEVVHLDAPGTINCLASLSDIAGIVRRSFEIGDRVRFGFRSYEIEAVSQDGGKLWLSAPGEEWITVDANKAELVFPEPEVVAADDAEEAQEAAQ